MEGWKTFEAEGSTWQVRLVTNPAFGLEDGQTVLEFQATGGTLPPRRVVVDHVSLEDLDDAALRSAFQKARPIGGDFYGRPGKKMTDAPES